MLQNKKEHPNVKSKLQPLNKNRKRYVFRQLIGSSPELATFVKPNRYGDESVDFAKPDAVKALNIALLIHHYELKYLDIPPAGAALRLVSCFAKAKEKTLSAVRSNWEPLAIWEKVAAIEFQLPFSDF